MRAAAAQAIEATAGQAASRASARSSSPTSWCPPPGASARRSRSCARGRPTSSSRCASASRARGARREARGGPPPRAGAPAPATTPAKRPAGVLDLSAGLAWPAGASSSPAWRTPFGARLARRLAADAGVERVVGVDTPPGRSRRSPSASTWSRPTCAAPSCRRWCARAAVDTVVHNDIVQFPEPGRPRARAARRQRHRHAAAADAAATALPTLRAIVVRGSAAIYGSEPAAPAFFTEEDADRFPLRTRFQRDVGELERLVGAFARRHPARRRARCCACSRSSGATSTRRSTASCARRSSRPCSATTRACSSSTPTTRSARCAGRCCHPVRGPVNVAADGVVSLSRALRHAGRPALPIAAPLWGPLVRRGAPRGRPARAARRDRALPALRARRRHHAHAPRAGLPPATHSTLEALVACSEGGPVDDRGRLGLRPRLRRAPLAPLLDAALHALVARARRRRSSTSRPRARPWSSPTRPAASRGTRRCSPPRCAATTVRPDDPPRFLVHGRAFELPWASTALRRLGGVPAAAGNAARLLAEGHAGDDLPRGRARRPAGLRAALPPRAPRARRLRRARAAQRRADRAVRDRRPAGPGLADRVLARVGAPAAPAAAAAGAAGARALADRLRRAAARRPATAPTPPRTARSCSSWAKTCVARVQEKVYDSLVNREGAL